MGILKICTLFELNISFAYENMVSYLKFQNGRGYITGNGLSTRKNVTLTFLANKPISQTHSTLR